VGRGRRGVRTGPDAAGGHAAWPDSARVPQAGGGGGARRVANDLALAITNQGVALRSLGRLEAALAAYDEAIRIRRRLVEEEGRGELASNLAVALYNLALAREDQGHPQALAAAREAREIWERLVSAGWAHLAANLEKARKLELRLTAGPS